MEFLTLVHVGDGDKVGFIDGSNSSSLKDLVDNNSIVQDKR